MKPDELRAIRNRNRMTQAGLAKALGISRRTVENWEQGRNPIPSPVEQLITMQWGAKK